MHEVVIFSHQVMGSSGSWCWVALLATRVGYELWCHSSAAALWCGEVLVALLEMLVGLLLDLKKSVSFLVYDCGEMLLALLSSCNARGLRVSGK